LSQAAKQELIDAIDALLPQTQCEQCGHAGCVPYAEAIADGAPVDRCPPGGDRTVRALAQLLGRRESTVAVDLAPYPGPRTAIIDEHSCIGCARCLPACPVDAIVGAAKWMHTVIAEQCTGCELCLAPCPVDCIRMMPADWDVHDAERASLARTRAREHRSRQRRRAETAEARRQARRAARRHELTR
jgi:electron transport complex protein RnfB